MCTFTAIAWTVWSLSCFCAEFAFNSERNGNFVLSVQIKSRNQNWQSFGLEFLSSRDWHLWGGNLECPLKPLSMILLRCMVSNSAPIWCPSLAFEQQQLTKKYFLNCGNSKSSNFPIGKFQQILDLNYPFPIDSAPNGIPFGAQINHWKVKLETKFRWINATQKRFLCVYIYL